MAKGFTKDGKFRPTGNNGRKSSKEKSVNVSGMKINKFGIEVSDDFPVLEQRVSDYNNLIADFGELIVLQVLAKGSNGDTIKTNMQDISDFSKEHFRLRDGILKDVENMPNVISAEMDLDTVEFNDAGELLDKVKEAKILADETGRITDSLEYSNPEAPEINGSRLGFEIAVSGSDLGTSSRNVEIQTKLGGLASENDKHTETVKKKLLQITNAGKDLRDNLDELEKRLDKVQDGEKFRKDIPELAELVSDQIDLMDLLSNVIFTENERIQNNFEVFKEKIEVVA